MNITFTGWWCTFQPLWKIWVSQLGWENSKLNGKVQNVPNHQPDNKKIKNKNKEGNNNNYGMVIRQVADLMRRGTSAEREKRSKSFLCPIWLPYPANTNNPSQNLRPQMGQPIPIASWRKIACSPDQKSLKKRIRWILWRPMKIAGFMGQL